MTGRITPRINDLIKVFVGTIGATDPNGIPE
jgi:hypothetical protein